MAKWKTFRVSSSPGVHPGVLLVGRAGCQPALPCPGMSGANVRSQLSSRLRYLEMGCRPLPHRLLLDLKLKAPNLKLYLLSREAPRLMINKKIQYCVLLSFLLCVSYISSIYYIKTTRKVQHAYS